MTAKLSYEEKLALWHRLREDPDFEPSWLKAMGPRPPVAPDSTNRTWGDGGGDKREHVVGDLSYEGQWITCRADGAVPFAGRTLEDAWDVHRGRADLVEARILGPATGLDEATDDEVQGFLDGLMGGGE